MRVGRWFGGGSVASGGRGHRWTLQELDAEWLATPAFRYNVGFSFDCPTHGTHRLAVRFDDPYDGLGPMEGEGLLVHMVANGSLDEVTVEMPNGDAVLDFNRQGFGECGKFRILDGVVERARFLVYLP